VARFPEVVPRTANWISVKGACIFNTVISQTDLVQILIKLLSTVYLILLYVQAGPLAS
jgi:hypothetical protein